MDAPRLEGLATPAPVLVNHRFKPLHEQLMTLLGGLSLQDWMRLKDTMLKIAEAMPEDRFGYRPTPPQRTFGEQILHIAEANVNQMGRFGSTVVAPAINMKATTKADILKALADLRVAAGHLPVRSGHFSHFRSFFFDALAHASHIRSSVTSWLRSSLAWSTPNVNGSSPSATAASPSFRSSSWVTTLS